MALIVYRVRREKAQAFRPIADFFVFVQSLAGEMISTLGTDAKS